MEKRIQKMNVLLYFSLLIIGCIFHTIEAQSCNVASCQYIITDWKNKGWAYNSCNFGECVYCSPCVSYPNQIPNSQPTMAPTWSQTPTFPPTLPPTVMPTWSQYPTVVPTVTPSFSQSPTVGPTLIPTALPSVLPTLVPILIPTLSPTLIPTTVPPTLSPTMVPTFSPTLTPTIVPTLTPTTTPTLIPSPVPTVVPTGTPTVSPTTIPTLVPTTSPSVIPTVIPSASPTMIPTVSPTMSPTMVPTMIPTVSPTMIPTVPPTMSPTKSPTTIPTVSPTMIPTVPPTMSPTKSPTMTPTVIPTMSPTMSPTTIPTVSPTMIPTVPPTVSPTMSPTMIPTVSPTTIPTVPPTMSPTMTPTVSPTISPTMIPTVPPTMSPTMSPTMIPTVISTVSPTKSPTQSPTITPTTIPTTIPTVVPSLSPTITPTISPTLTPSLVPTHPPSLAPTQVPTTTPTVQPSHTPTTAPTIIPTQTPTTIPTNLPTTTPTPEPSTSPTAIPTVLPTAHPTMSPTFAPTLVPTSSPTVTPTVTPSVIPTQFPTQAPTATPTAAPTLLPTQSPTQSPTSSPTFVPTDVPTTIPTAIPTVAPTQIPTYVPTLIPTVAPTTEPTMVPSWVPSLIPTISPSSVPSVSPSVLPTVAPTTSPTVMPSVPPTFFPTTNPTDIPSHVPTAAPTVSPTEIPTYFPTCYPSCVPTEMPTDAPSYSPTTAPTTVPTTTPTYSPTTSPTAFPTSGPSTSPTEMPSEAPTAFPTLVPTATPTAVPSFSPTTAPTEMPTHSPTNLPSVSPTEMPTDVPTVSPTVLPTLAPTYSPSQYPTVVPTETPTNMPTLSPTSVPTEMPSRLPTCNPSRLPNIGPTETPSYLPTVLPSVTPTEKPTEKPTLLPTVIPTASPTCSPTYSPTPVPTSSAPTELPTYRPSIDPSVPSTNGPISVAPTMFPTRPPERSLALRSAQFNNEGAKVTFQLTAPVDISESAFRSSFPCKNVIAPVSSLASCSFIDTYTIESYDTTLFDVASSIYLSPSTTLRALCDNMIPCVITTILSDIVIVVQKGENPISPSIMIYAKSNVGLCDNLYLDLTSTTGNIGREWKRFNVTLSAGDDVSTYEKSVMLNALLESFSTDVPMVISRSKLTSSKVPYDITFIVCNIFDRCASTLFKVNVTDDGQSPPTVDIAGASYRSMKRSSVLSLTASASLIQCSGNASTLVSGANLKTSWQVFIIKEIGGVKTEVLQDFFTSISKDKFKFVLPSFSLEAGKTYKIAFTATDPFFQLSGTKVVFVEIVRSPLVAIISPKVESLQLRVGMDTLQLDAGSSYDPDFEASTVDNGKSIFVWNCMSVSKSLSFPNDALLRLWNQNLLDPTSTICPVRWTAQGSRVNVEPVNETWIGTTAAMIVTISDGVARNSSSLIQIRLIEGDSPRITIGTSINGKVNTKSKTVLNALIQTNLPCQAKWSLNENSNVQSLQSITSSALQKYIPGDKEKEVSISLVLLGNTLPSLQASYVFSLVCGSGAASITITTNGPPMGGSFAISPTSGEELTTYFSMMSIKWTDVDLPLSYQFGYLTLVSAQVVELVVRNRLESSFSTTQLPAGSSSNRQLLNCTMTVFDTLDASSTVTSSVKVTAMSVADLQSKILSSIGQISTSNSNSTMTMTPQEMQQFVAASSTALNRVDCSSAPDCSSLNRYGCSTKANTCGLCMTGYIGDSSESNSVCMSTEVMKNKQMTNVPSVDMSCKNDSSCFSWQSCLPDCTGLAFSTCQDKEKTCSNDCSGHGNCLFIRSDDRAPWMIGRCTLFNPSCVGQCKCEEGYAGSSCSMTESELANKALMRESLIVGLAQSLPDDQTKSVESIVNVASSLQSILSVSDELSSSAITVASQIARQTMEQALVTPSISSTDVLGILSVADSSLKAQEHSSSSSTTAVELEMLSIVSSFGNILFNENKVGGNMTSLVYDNFRLSSTPGTSIATPLTELERMNNLNNSASLNGLFNDTTTQTFLTDDLMHQVQVIEVPKLFWRTGNMSSDNRTSNSNLLSNIVSIQTSNIESIGIAMRKDKEVAVSITDGNRTLTSYCQLGVVSTAAMLCSDSNITIQHSCSGKDKGVLETYCPSPTIGCVPLSLETLSIESSLLDVCTLRHNTDHSVLCKCDMPSKSRRRRLTSNGVVDDILYETGALTVGLMIYYVANDFKSSFSAAPNALSSAQDTQKVAIVIAMFGIMWFVGFLFVGISIVRKRRSNNKVKDLIASNLKRGGLKETRINRKRRISNIAYENVTCSAEQLRQRLNAYVESVIPHVFKTSSSIFQSAKFELMKHHSYLRLFSSTKLDRSLTVTICQLLTIQTLMMFLIAVLYDLQGPDDDGSCPPKLTKSSCLQRKSLFDSTQSYCKWVSHIGSSTGEGSEEWLCVYNEINVTAEVGIYCAVVASLFTGLMIRPVDYLFSILAASTLKKKASVMHSPEQVVVATSSSNNTHRARTMTNIAPADGTEESTMVKIVKFLPDETKDAYIQARLSVFMHTKSAHAVPLVTTEQRPEKDRMNGIRNSEHVSLQDNKTEGHFGFSQLVQNLQTTRTLLLQRYSVDDDVVKVFDHNWGFDSATGDFKIFLDVNASESNHLNKIKPIAIESQSNDSHSHHHLGSSVFHHVSVAELIEQTLQHTQEKTSHVLKDVHGSSDEQIGVEILQLFIQDLLGNETPAAKIFRVKTNEDYVYRSVVPFYHKVISCTVLVILNAFFIYYSILRGYQKGLQWQRSFLIACFIQTMADIVFYQTFECIYVHVFLPRLVSRKNFNRVKYVLGECIEKFSDESFKLHDKHYDQALINAPDFLFVSNQVAKAYPTLMESMLISSYKSYLPGKISENWHTAMKRAELKRATLSSDSTNEVSWFKKMLLLPLSTLGSFLVIELLTMIPIEVQRMFIRFLEPLVLSCAVSIGVVILRNESFLIYAIVIFMTIVGAVSIWYWKTQINELLHLTTREKKQDNGDTDDCHIDDAYEIDKKLDMLETSQVKSDDSSSVTSSESDHIVNIQIEATENNEFLEKLSNEEDSSVVPVDGVSSSLSMASYLLSKWFSSKNNESFLYSSDIETDDSSNCSDDDDNNDDEDDSSFTGLSSQSYLSSSQYQLSSATSADE